MRLAGVLFRIGTRRNKKQKREWNLLQWVIRSDSGWSQEAFDHGALGAAKPAINHWRNECLRVIYNKCLGFGERKGWGCVRRATAAFLNLGRDRYFLPNLHFKEIILYIYDFKEIKFYKFWIYKTVPLNHKL